MAKTFTFEEAVAPATFSFEEAMGQMPLPEGVEPSGGRRGLADDPRRLDREHRLADMAAGASRYGDDPVAGQMLPQSSMPAASSAPVIPSDLTMDEATGKVPKAKTAMRGKSLEDAPFDPQAAAALSRRDVAERTPSAADPRRRAPSAKPAGEGFVGEAASRTGMDVAGDITAAGLKIGPTALKTLAQVYSLGTGGLIGEGASKQLDAGMGALDNAFGSNASKVERLELANILRSPDQGGTALAAYLLKHPTLMADMGITTVGSMFVPAGAVGIAAKASRAPLQAKTATAISQAVNDVMNAAGTFEDTQGDVGDKYLAAAIAALGSRAAGKLTGGGVEGQMARRMAGEKLQADGFLNKATTVGRELGKESTQEYIENFTQSVGQDVGEGKPVDLTGANKQGVLGAVIAPIATGPVSIANVMGAQPVPAYDAETMARERGFLRTDSAAAPATSLMSAVAADPVAAIQAAPTVDDAIRTAAAAVDQTIAETRNDAAAAAVDNIAAILGVEGTNVGSAPGVPGLVDSGPGGGSLDSAPGVAAGVGTDAAGGPALDAGRAGDQQAAGAVRMGAGQPGALASIEGQGQPSAKQRLGGAEQRIGDQAAGAEPSQVWFGRRGDGYQTRGDAEMALPSRQRIAPDLSWRLEQMPTGRFRLAGYAPVLGAGAAPTVQAAAPTPSNVPPTPANALATPSNVQAAPAPAVAPVEPAEQPTPFTVRMNPTGTLTVQGNAAEIRAFLNSQGITRMTPTRGGALTIPTSQAAQAQEALANYTPGAPVTPAPAKLAANPLKTFLIRHGISMKLAGEFAPGARERLAMGSAFRNNGMEIDQLAELAAEAGFIQDASDTDTLYDLISRVANGERVGPTYGQDGDTELQARIDRQREMERGEYEAAQEAARSSDDALWAALDEIVPAQGPDEDSTMSLADAMNLAGYTEEESANAERAAQEAQDAAEAGRRTAETPQGEAQADPRGRDQEARADAQGLTDLPGFEPGDTLERFGPRGLKGNAWVLREKATGRAVMETSDPAKVRALNTAKYEAVPVGRHLADLNDPATAAYAAARRQEDIQRPTDSSQAVDQQARRAAGDRAEQKIRDAFRAVPSVSIGVAAPITITHNGVTQQFMARQDRLATARTPATIHLTRLKRGRMLRGDPETWILESYKLTGADELVPDGLPKKVSDAEARQFQANFAAEPDQDLFGAAPNASQQEASRLRAEQARREAAARNAAPDASGFGLTGSDRARDEGAAAGQQDITDTGLSAADTQTVVTTFQANGLNLQVADTEADLPDSAQKRMRSEGISGVRGLYDPATDTTWIVRSNLGSKEEAFFVGLHEAFHRGLGRTFGKDVNAILGYIELNNKAVRDKAREYRAKYGMDRYEAIEEVLADMAGEGRATDLKGWDRLMTFLRQVIQAMARGIGVNIKVTDAMVEQLVAGIRKEGMRDGPAFVVRSNQGPMFLRVFHGTPHEVDRFSTEKIGTGEGAQAYGWGLYFAGKREVAEHYRKQLTQGLRGVNVDGVNIVAPIKDFGKTTAKERAAVWAARALTQGQDLAAKAREIRMMAEWAERNPGSLSAFQVDAGWGDAALLREAADILDDWAGRDTKKISGRLYEVNIPEEGEYLLWDKPLSEQPEGVNKAVQKVERDRLIVIMKQRINARAERVKNGEDTDALDRQIEVLREEIDAFNLPLGGTGERYYKSLSMKMGGPKEASDYLRSLGIRGIKYLDGTSRAGGDGTYNYVVFDDKDVEIKARFSRRTEEADRNTLEALSKSDELFALPKSDKDTIAGIAADTNPAITVREVKGPLTTIYVLTMPDGAKARITVRRPNPYGPQSYGFLERDGDMESVVERPGTNPEDVDPDTEDVYIDASLLREGGAGAQVYNIAATFAHNTGRIFIGDPAGLSDVAMRRRTEQMLSSALKFGTTAHLAPHPRQVMGDRTIGVPPMRWTYGDDVGNIESLIRTSLAAFDYADTNPLTFEPGTGRFLDRAGRELDARAISSLARAGSGREAGAGVATLKRNAILRALLSEEGGKRPGWGGRVLADLLDVASQPGAPARQVFYSRVGQGAGASTTTGNLFGDEGEGDLFATAAPEPDPAPAPALAPEPAAPQPTAAQAPTQGTIQDLGEKIGGARKDTAEKGFTRRKAADDEESRPAWARRFKIAQIVATGQIDQPNVGRWVISDSRSLDRMGKPKQVGGWGKTFATKEEAEAYVPIAAVSLKHRPVPTSGGKYEIWRDITDRKRVKVVDQQFDTRDEAMAYMAQHAADIVETNTTFGEADLPPPPDRARTGPARRTGDVRDTDFMATFGFRGVEFGNWNNQDERQALMNDAYDGLLDLAEVLGVPPKALALNGDLALAFGARGQGLNSARAHYEARRTVINLTKERGAGSLAHEWFHALDHYFARQDGKAPQQWKKNADGTRELDAGDPEQYLASHGFRLRDSGVREEVRKAYANLIATMFKKAEAYVEDTAKADAFTARAKEDLAQQLDSLRRDLSEQKDPRYWKRNNKPASAEQLAQFDTIAKAMLDGEVQTLETDWRTVKTATGKATVRWTNDTLEQLGELYKAVRGRSGFSAERSGTLDSLRGYMNRYSQRLKMLADAQAETQKTKMVPTEFAMNAKELDQGRGGDYWTTPHEMAARAFQGYVEDKVAERGGMSRFLNYAPENAGIITPWGMKRPYPAGAERKAINAAIDGFVKSLRTRETDQGVAMFSRPTAEPTRSGTPKALRTIEVDGKRRPVEDSRGRLVGRDFKEQVNFWKWFGDSQTVDAEGKPLVVYHGTKADFSEFKRTRGGEFGPAIYMTDSPREASEYGDGKGWGGPSGTQVMPVYVSIKNPYTKGVDAFWKEFGGADSDAAALDRAQAAGYDGIIAERADRYYDNKLREFVDRGDMLTHYIAFRPEQIKSAIGNNGAYSPDSANILEDITSRAYTGYGDDVDTPRVQAARKLNKLIQRRDEGKISEGEFDLKVRMLANQMTYVSEVKQAKRTFSERETGADYIRERLLRARRQGELDSQTVELGLWLLDQNPAIADGLGISIRSPRAGSGAGTYDPSARIASLFKNRTNAGTAVHEILHHSERMMPEEVQKGIAKAWGKAYTKALKEATPKQRAALEQMAMAMAGSQDAQKAVRAAFRDGVLDYSKHYQLTNPSEFWAVNATRILTDRAGAEGWVQRARQWLTELIQKAKAIFGLQSDAPVLKGIQAVLDGDGTFVSKRMLSNADLLGDIRSAPDTKSFQAWAEGLPVVEEDVEQYDGGPAVFVAYHGTTHPDITVFKEQGNAEGFLGAGPYFTTSAADASANYAGVGPDLTNRIEREYENILQGMQDDDYAATEALRDYYDAHPEVTPVEGWEDENTQDAVAEHGDAAAKYAATQQLKGKTDGLMMKAFVKLKNPADTTEQLRSPDLTYEVVEDENGDIVEEKGTLIDWIEAARTVADGYGTNFDDYIGALLENGDGTSMGQAFNLALKHLAEVYDEDGNVLTGGAVFREIAKEAGYDGVVMDADMHFGSGRRGFGGARIPSMAGVQEGTLHIVPFDSRAVKSATGNRGSFDGSNPDIRFSRAGVPSQREFKGWPKTIPWTRTEYNSVVRWLPDDYRDDPQRRDPLPAQGRDVLGAAELQARIAKLNQDLGRPAHSPLIRLDGLGNLTFDAQALPRPAEDLGKIIALADELDLGIYASHATVPLARILSANEFTTEPGLSTIVSRNAGTNDSPMPDLGTQGYGTVMSRKPRGFSDMLFSRATAGPTQAGTPAALNPQTSPWRDETGRLQFAPGAWLYEKFAPEVGGAVMGGVTGAAAGPVGAAVGAVAGAASARIMLNKLQLKAATPELRRALREMKLQVQKAQETASAVAKESMKLTEAERAMVSDLIEQELAAGTVPPAHAVRLAAMINASMEAQTDELVRLGMLTKDSADMWRGKYLPRYYESKLVSSKTQDVWAEALRKLTGRPKTMAGVKGKHLRGRGLYETIPEAELPQWEAMGWQVRDPGYQPGLTDDGTVQVWRDFSRQERDSMGEIRDAGFRFVMGYMETQRDIALGRMFEALANDPKISSKRETEEFSVRVPDGTVPGTGAKRYGKMAGRWVSKDTLSHLSAIEEAQSEAWQMYRQAMAIWKESKTVLNPVSHVNNVLSNLTMAHLAGVSYLRGDKYLAAARDFAMKAPEVQEAKEAGLFLGTMSDAELMNVLPEDLKALVRKQDSTATKVGRTAFNVMTFWLRRPMGWAYQAEDTFFRYLIYKDARERGLDAADAVDYAQKYIFTYDDLPKGARMIRDFGLPFFSYTYKAVPALLQTALEHPLRMAMPAAILWAANAAAYAIAAGDDDDSWEERLKKYLTDADYREKVRAKEKLEREHLPSWMKGTTALMTPKTVRLGMDEVTKLPVFIDMARVIPGGDLFDVAPNAGGIPLPQPITPSHPLFTTAVAMLGNKDLFTGRELVDSNDTRVEAAQKRADWLWKQLTPAITAGNAHWERGMNALAQATGQEIRWLPEAIAPNAVATGVGRDGLPVQPKYAAMQTFGIKARPIDVEMSEQMEEGKKRQMIRQIDTEMRRLRLLMNKGAVPESGFERELERANLKKDRLRSGLTVDGEEKP